MPDLIRYQVQDGQGVQKRRGIDEWTGTHTVGVEWRRRTGPRRIDHYLDRSTTLLTLTLFNCSQDLTPPVGRSRSYGGCENSTRDAVSLAVLAWETGAAVAHPLRSLR